MNLFDTTQLGLEKAIAGASMRQGVLASNIANANTPNYQRKDVDFHSALQAAMGTNDRSAVESVTFGETTDEGTSMRVDGNGVDIDAESSTLAQNGLEYEALVSVARGRNDIIRAAMGQ